MCIFILKSRHFIFNKCPIYTHDGESANFSTNSHKTDYSDGYKLRKDCCTYKGAQK